MNTYPMLREETDRIVLEHLREQELKTKDMVRDIKFIHQL